MRHLRMINFRMIRLSAIFLSKRRLQMIQFMHFVLKRLFLQRSFQISSHVDTIFRIMMSSSSLNEKNKILISTIKQRMKKTIRLLFSKILRIVKFYFVTWCQVKCARTWPGAWPEVEPEAWPEAWGLLVSTFHHNAQ
jgi:hypothetical protein